MSILETFSIELVDLFEKKSVNYSEILLHPLYAKARDKKLLDDSFIDLLLSIRQLVKEFPDFFVVFELLQKLSKEYVYSCGDCVKLLFHMASFFVMEIENSETLNDVLEGDLALDARNQARELLAVVAEYQFNSLHAVIASYAMLIQLRFFEPHQTVRVMKGFFQSGLVIGKTIGVFVESVIHDVWPEIEDISFVLNTMDACFIPSAKNLIKLFMNEIFELLLLVFSSDSDDSIFVYFSEDELHFCLIAVLLCNYYLIRLNEKIDYKRVFGCVIEILYTVKKNHFTFLYVEKYDGALFKLLLQYFLHLNRMDIGDMNDFFFNSKEQFTFFQHIILDKFDFKQTNEKFFFEVLVYFFSFEEDEEETRNFDGIGMLKSKEVYIKKFLLESTFDTVKQDSTSLEYFIPVLDSLLDLCDSLFVEAYITIIRLIPHSQELQYFLLQHILNRVLFAITQDQTDVQLCVDILFFIFDDVNTELFNVAVDDLIGAGKCDVVMAAVNIFVDIVLYIQQSISIIVLHMMYGRIFSFFEHVSSRCSVFFAWKHINVLVSSVHMGEHVSRLFDLFIFGKRATLEQRKIVLQLLTEHIISNEAIFPLFAEAVFDSLENAMSVGASFLSGAGNRLEQYNIERFFNEEPMSDQVMFASRCVDLIRYLLRVYTIIVGMLLDSTIFGKKHREMHSKPSHFEMFRSGVRERLQMLVNLYVAVGQINEEIDVYCIECIMCLLTIVMRRDDISRRKFALVSYYFKMLLEINLNPKNTVRYLKCVSFFHLDVKKGEFSLHLDSSCWFFLHDLFKKDDSTVLRFIPSSRDEISQLIENMNKLHVNIFHFAIKSFGMKRINIFVTDSLLLSEASLPIEFLVDKYKFFDINSYRQHISRTENRTNLNKNDIGVVYSLNLINERANAFVTLLNQLLLRNQRFYMNEKLRKYTISFLEELLGKNKRRPLFLTATIENNIIRFFNYLLSSMPQDQLEKFFKYIFLFLTRVIKRSNVTLKQNALVLLLKSLRNYFKWLLYMLKKLNVMEKKDMKDKKKMKKVFNMYTKRFFSIFKEFVLNNLIMIYNHAVPLANKFISLLLDCLKLNNLSVYAFLSSNEVLVPLISYLTEQEVSRPGVVGYGCYLLKLRIFIQMTPIERKQCVSVFTDQLRPNWPISGLLKSFFSTYVDSMMPVFYKRYNPSLDYATYFDEDTTPDFPTGEFVSLSELPTESRNAKTRLISHYASPNKVISIIVDRTDATVLMVSRTAFATEEFVFGRMHGLSFGTLRLLNNMRCEEPSLPEMRRFWDTLASPDGVEYFLGVMSEAVVERSDRDNSLGGVELSTESFPNIMTSVEERLKTFAEMEAHSVTITRQGTPTISPVPSTSPSLEVEAISHEQKRVEVRKVDAECQVELDREKKMLNFIGRPTERKKSVATVELVQQLQRSHHISDNALLIHSTMYEEDSDFDVRSASETNSMHSSFAVSDIDNPEFHVDSPINVSTVPINRPVSANPFSTNKREFPNQSVMFMPGTRMPFNSKNPHLPLNMISHAETVNSAPVSRGGSITASPSLENHKKSFFFKKQHKELFLDVKEAIPMSACMEEPLLFKPTNDGPKKRFLARNPAVAALQLTNIPAPLFSYVRHVSPSLLYEMLCADEFVQLKNSKMNANALQRLDEQRTVEIYTVGVLYLSSIPITNEIYKRSSTSNPFLATISQFGEFYREDEMENMYGSRYSDYVLMHLSDLTQITYHVPFLLPEVFDARKQIENDNIVIVYCSEDVNAEKVPIVVSSAVTWIEIFIEVIVPEQTFRISFRTTSSTPQYVKTLIDKESQLGCFRNNMLCSFSELGYVIRDVVLYFSRLFKLLPSGLPGGELKEWWTVDFFGNRLRQINRIFNQNNQK
ncbi:hypothetical protein PCE1_002502 [Barthelona sp. PCE]